MEIEVIEPAEAETLENPGEGQTANEPETTAATPEGDAPADEVVVTIGDAEPPAEEQDKAPEWVRDLRKQHRELQKEKRELEQKLAAIQAPAPQATLGKKPTLEDHEYDADRYEAALTKWFEDKRKVDEVNAQREAEQQTQAQQWAKKLESYGEAKSKLKVQDFDEAEHTVMESMNQTQQGIILQGAENPALLVYALGKNPAKAKELAAIKDPVKYAFAIAKLETQLKVTPRKPPAPERTISGTGPVSGSSDSHLERLRAEAEKTGDMTKVIQYKRQLADKARS
jgi:hypothetical protein